MIIFRFLLFFFLIATGCISQGADLKIVWNEKFDNPGSLQSWAGANSATWIKNLEKGNAVYLKNEHEPSSCSILYKLPNEMILPGSVHCSAWIKWRNVSEKPNEWNGVKFMLVIDSSSTGRSWLQKNLPAGTSEWQRVNFDALVSPGTTNITLHLGLENVSGEVWFSDITLVQSIISEDSLLSLRHENIEDTHPQHHRLRGAMISPSSFTIEDLNTIHSWGANLLRWQLIYTLGNPTDEEYDQWLANSLDKLEKFLPEIVKRNMLIVLDLHSPPGGIRGSGGYVTAAGLIWQERRYQDKFVNIWENIAQRFKDVPGIWGFDLMNEPADDNVAEGLDSWQKLVERTAWAIRNIDPNRTLIIEPNHWGNPDAFVAFHPLAMDNIVYSPHFYYPHQFTHQALNKPDEANIRYPGEINGMLWNKEQMRKALQPVFDFQKKYNVPIYIGEFSAIRWAPDQSAYRYLRDAIELFEEYGWDWSYHAYREWHGWSVEHNENYKDINRASEPTLRQKLLMEYLEKCKNNQ